MFMPVVVLAFSSLGLTVYLPCKGGLFHPWLAQTLTNAWASAGVSDVCQECTTWCCLLRHFVVEGVRVNKGRYTSAWCCVCVVC
jgi:hypothetical protein